MEYLQKWFAHFELLIAGVVGAIIALPFQRDLKTNSSKLVFIFSGAACAHYLTGLATHFLEIDPSSAGSIGFLLGAFGGSMIAAVMRGITNADLWALVRGRFGGPSE